MNRLQFDSFEIGEHLGTGTVGTVYRVVDKETGAPYALKLLSEAVSNDKLIVSRFEREMAILAKLNHPHIVQYFGSGKKDGKLFYVMELLTGGTLKQLLYMSGALGWMEAAECGRQISSALQHAHNHGIIHRDVKPGNVYLTADAQMKLGDFGIVRDMKANDLTDTGLTVGTYAYMCPELISGERNITGKVDLYALGCLLFEIVAGRTPFVGDNFAQFFQQHLQDPAPDLEDLGIPCPPRFNKIVHQLLAKDPEDRPFNARAVQGVLGELLNADAKVATGDTTHDAAAGDVTMAQQRLARRLVGTATPRDVSWSAVMGLLATIIAILISYVLISSG